MPNLIAVKRDQSLFSGVQTMTFNRFGDWEGLVAKHDGLVDLGDVGVAGGEAFGAVPADDL